MQNGTKMKNKNSLSSNLLLADVLLASRKSIIYIPDFIKANAKTRAIAKLRGEFEKLLKEDNRFSAERTSEIFITLGTKRGERELKYYPKVRGYWISHVRVISD